MIHTRETLYAAIFAYFAALTVGGSPAFRNATRRVAQWEKYLPEEQPALLMRQRNEVAEHRKFMPTKWVLNIDLLVYVHTAASIDNSVIPSQLLNPLLDVIEDALTIDDILNSSCTLGGLVSYAAIDGTVDIHLGSLDDSAAAIVPVRILVNT